MTKEEHIEYWLKTSEHDFETSKDVFEKGRYDWSLFILHLAIEKLLKAVWVKNNDNTTPPKIHNLIKLAELSNFELSEVNKELLLDITSFNIETRYPDYKMDFYKTCTEEFAKSYFNKSEELIKCIREKI